MKPFFSIIVPTYNRGYILKSTILSIQQQNWKNWELLIIDDGSTDNTKSVVHNFQTDKRIQYYHQDNAGPAAARNLGMSRATGDIITFIDSDDPVYPFYLDAGIKHLYNDTNKSFALSHCDFFYEMYDDKGILIGRKPAPINHNPQIDIEDIYHWRTHVAIGTGLFIKPDIFANKVSWNSEIIPGDDIEFVMQLASIDKDGFTYIPQALFEYRQRYGGDGLCSNTTYGQWAEMFEKIYALHKSDSLMTQPEQYLRRVEKYKKLQLLLDKNQVVPPKYKYFPELWVIAN